MCVVVVDIMLFHMDQRHKTKCEIDMKSYKGEDIFSTQCKWFILIKSCKSNNFTMYVGRSIYPIMRGLCTQIVYIVFWKEG